MSGGHEISKAYPAMQEQWPGRLIRVQKPASKNWPDFGLVHPEKNGRVAWLEVKALPAWEQSVKDLTPGQAKELDSLAKDGFRAGMLVACLAENSDSITKWLVYWSRPDRRFFMPSAGSRIFWRNETDEACFSLTVDFIFGKA